MSDNSRSRRAGILRMMHICQKLRHFPQDLDSIFDYLEDKGIEDEIDYSIDKRTFQRDLKDIFYIFGIEIKYNRGLKKYEIKNQEKDGLRYLESVDTINALRFRKSVRNGLIFEERNPLGTEYLNGFLHAIQNKKVVHFHYKRYEETAASKREIEPYALKEFKHRWYIVGKNRAKDEIRIYGLDRIQGEIQIMPESYGTTDFDAKAYFEHCFGIIRPDWMEPQEVVLGFKPLKAAYVSHLPWHHSQEIVKQDKDETQMRFYVYPTYDLVQEILSHGDEVRVLHPESLKEEVKRKKVAEL